MAVVLTPAVGLAGHVEVMAVMASIDRTLTSFVVPASQCPHHTFRLPIPGELNLATPRTITNDHNALSFLYAFVHLGSNR